MNNSIDLTNHIFQTATLQINKICRPFFQQTNAKVFRYLRLFNDGSRIMFGSHPETPRYLYNEGNYSKAWYDTGTPPISYTGWNSWETIATFNNTQQQAMHFEIQERCGISHGIHYLNVLPTSYEVFVFSSDSSNIYLEERNIFDRFIFYFREHTHKMLNCALADRIILPLPYGRIIYKNELSSVSNSSKKKLPIKKYFLTGKYLNTYLTHTEVEVMQRCAAGNCSKRIAALLGISNRTIEHHINNVKYKLKCKKQSEVLKILISMGVIS